MPVDTLIQLRKGTSSAWASTNPVLASGEPGHDTTINIIKIGDGITPWSSLSSLSTNIGSTSNLPLITSTSGIVTTGTFGTVANSFCQGNDSRLTKTIAFFDPSMNQPPSTNYATLDTRNSILVLDFDDGSTNEEAIFVGVIPEGASLSSGLDVRINWMSTNQTSGQCRWGVQFEKMNTDTDTDSFDTATEAHSTTSATAGIPTITTIRATSIDSLAAGDFFRMKIYRDSSDTTNDTMVGDAELISIELKQVI